MKKTILISILFLMLLCSFASAAMVYRSVDKTNIKYGDTIKMRYEISAAASHYAGVITDIIPNGYSFVTDSLESNFNTVSHQISGQTITINFDGDVSNQYAEIEVIAGPQSAILANGQVEFSTGSIYYFDPIKLSVEGSSLNCLGGCLSGNKDNQGWITLAVIIGAGLIIMRYKK